MPERTVEVGDTMKQLLASYFRDPDGDPLTYSATVADAGLASVEVVGDTVSVAALAKGVTTVTVTATDPEGLAAVQAFNVTVPNRSPVAVGTPPADTVAVGETTTLDPSTYFRDPDGDPLTFAASAADSSVAGVSVADGTVAVTAIAKGGTAVTIAAADTEGLTAVQAFNVTVPNRAPVAIGTAPADTVPVGETATRDLLPYYRDPDGDTLVYTASTSDSAVIGVAVSGGAVAVTAAAKGVATVTVTATDTEGLEAVQAFTVTVPNRAPVAGDPIPARTLQVGDTLALTLSAWFSDPDGDPLSFAAAASNPTAARVAVSDDALTVIADAKGQTFVTVTASDGEGAPATRTFAVSVSNQHPVTAATMEARALTSGDSATLELSAYFADPDGDALTFAAAVTDTTVVAVSVSGIILTLAAASGGFTTVTVTATDTEGLAAAQEFTVTVSIRNRAPVAVGALPELRLTEKGIARLRPASVFSDPDMDSLVFEAQSSDLQVARTWVSLGTVLVRAVAKGTATVTVTARDPSGLSATQEFGVRVRQGRDTNPNHKPVAVGAIPNQSLEEGDLFILDAAPRFSDPDGDELKFAAASADTVWPP